VTETSLEFTGADRYALASRLAAGLRVLDAACGEGNGSAILAEVAADVTGIERDAGTVRRARETHQEPNLRFMCCDCENLPLGDGSMDLVTSFETIEQSRDPRKMLAEFRRVLAPGGQLLLSSSNAALGDVLAGIFEPVEVYGQNLALCGPARENGDASSDAHAQSGNGRNDPQARCDCEERWREERAALVREHLEALQAHDRRRDEEERARASALEQVAVRDRAALEAVLASQSWRLTRPLRQFGRIVRGLRAR
jgi:SAM-dependent methyltransferase